jgi:hypothetical protein
MNASELKQLVKSQGFVTVRLTQAVANAGPETAGNLSDFGTSVASDSTYLQAGMKANIIDACTMPPMHKIDDARPYNNFVEAGKIYFVFHHGHYLNENESIASRDWRTDSPGLNGLSVGTAYQVGCYTGFDVVAFLPGDDVGHLFEFLPKPNTDYAGFDVIGTSAEE